MREKSSVLYRFVYFIMSRFSLKRALGVGQHDDSHRFTSSQALWLGGISCLSLPGSVLVIFHAWPELPHPVVETVAVVVAFASAMGALGVATLPPLGWIWGTKTDKKELLGSVLAAIGITLTILVVIWIRAQRSNL